jgi:quercetin dioxygenase-like cupin family protein
MSRKRTLALSLTVLLAGATGAQRAPAPSVVSKVEFENEFVRIERVTIPVGFKSPLHTHPRPSVEVFLTDDHVREALPNGTSKDYQSKAGDVVWNDTVTHRVENLSPQSVTLISIEIKGRPAAGQRSGAPAAGEAKVELENDWVRVVRGRISPGQKSPVHSHPRYVGIFLSETKLRATLADGSQREISGKRGDVSWREPVTHSIENLAATPFEAIDVNLKTLPAEKSAPPSKR